MISSDPTYPILGYKSHLSLLVSPHFSNNTNPSPFEKSSKLFIKSTRKMGINDDLVLGLGLTATEEQMSFNKSSSPSLTLSLFCETFNQIKKVEVFSNDGQDSAASSLSNVSVKRERDEEVEIERVSSRVSDEDDDGSNGRKKLRLTKTQSALLEDSFKLHSTLNPKQKQELASELKLRPRQVEVWFQNRRARTKLKQTEVEYELLKKCCETLTVENQCLLKELQELKTLKLMHPLYMQLPAATTLTMCPSCERIGGAAAASENVTKRSFAKPQFYNRFTNP